MVVARCRIAALMSGSRRRRRSRIAASLDCSSQIGDTSAWRAVLGNHGVAEIVEITVTRTPRRCTASTARKSPVAGEQHDLVDMLGGSIASTASSISMLP